MTALKPRLACGIVLLVGIWVCRISFIPTPAEAILFPGLISMAFVALAAWTFVRSPIGKQSLDLDGSSVNFRSIMVPRGTPHTVIGKLGTVMPGMFSTSRVPSRMAAGGSPVHVMTRENARPCGMNATPGIASFSRISDRLAGPGQCPCLGLPCEDNT